MATTKIKKAYIKVDKITERELQEGTQIELTTVYGNRKLVEILDINSVEMIPINYFNPSTNLMETGITPKISFFRDFYDNVIETKYEINKIIVNPKFESDTLIINAEFKTKDENNETKYEPIENFEYSLNITLGRLTRVNFNVNVINGEPLLNEDILKAQELGINLTNDSDNNIIITTQFDFIIQVIKNDVIYSDENGFTNGIISVIK